MRNEILAGLKNALERGESIEESIQTFINAGYNPVEVRESANILAGGASYLINPSNQDLQQSKSSSQIISAPLQQIPVQVLNQPSQNSSAPNPTLPIISSNNKSASPKKRVILLIIILIFLIALVLLFIIYKDDLLALFKYAGLLLVWSGKPTALKL